MAEQLHKPDLPTLPPAEYFDHELYWIVASRYWQDEALVELKDAVTAAVEDMTPPQLLQATHLLDEFAFSRMEETDVYDPSWLDLPATKRYTDEDGIIYGAIGHISDVKEILSEDEAENICILLREDIIETALQRASGSDADFGVETLLDIEAARRSERALLRIQNATSQAASSNLLVRTMLRSVK